MFMTTLYICMHFTIKLTIALEGEELWRSDSFLLYSQLFTIRTYDDSRIQVIANKSGNYRSIVKDNASIHIQLQIYYYFVR